jgi:proline iminopeptidase
MNPRLIIGAALALGALLALAAVARHLLRAPMWAPGMVRAGKNPGGSLSPPAQGGDPSYWIVEPGVRLFHQAIGAGMPVLVLHGGPGIPPREPWRALATLADRHRFHFYDQRGCGRSSRPLEKLDGGFAGLRRLEGQLGLGQQLADVERIRRILGEESLVIVGHSFGAFLAALYAAEFPERVRALVLVAPADVLRLPAEDGGLFEQLRRALPQTERPAYEAYLKRLLDFGSLASQTETSMARLNAELGPYYRRALAARGLPPPPHGDLAPEWVGGLAVPAMYLSMGRTHDWTGALARVRAPALVLHGARDLQPERASRRYAEALPRARMLVIPSAGHFAYDDAPEAFAEALGTFLQQLGLDGEQLRPATSAGAEATAAVR